MKLHLTPMYEAIVFSAIRGNEEFQATLTMDSYGTPYIGYGFNLLNHQLLRCVMESMGFDLLGRSIDGALLEAEHYYFNAITRIINAAPLAGLEITTSNLNAVMIERYYDGRYRHYPDISRRKTFSYRKISEAKLSINLIAELCEHELDNWLVTDSEELVAVNPGLFSHDTKERVALLSAVYRGAIRSSNNLKTLPKLHQALLDDNRAEAWFQLRYHSAGCESSQKEFVKHAYYESELFGLYDEGINAARNFREICKTIYGTYNKYRQHIMAYEKRYMGLINQANLKFGLNGKDKIKTLEQSFQLAYDSVRKSDMYTRRDEQYHHGKSKYITHDAGEIVDQLLQQKALQEKILQQSVPQQKALHQKTLHQKTLHQKTEAA